MEERGVVGWGGFGDAVGGVDCTGVGECSAAEEAGPRAEDSVFVGLGAGGAEPETAVVGFFVGEVCATDGV
jgi:hypothetical protein